jgi:hypothetical protein
MTDEQRRDREHRGLLVSTIAFVAALLADFFSNVFANYVRFPAGTANWLLRNWSQLAVGLTLIALIVFAARRFVTERARARADEAGPVQPDATFPPSAALVGQDEVVREVAARARRRGVVVVHGPAGIGASAVAVAAGQLLAPRPGSQRYVDLRGQSLWKPESPRRSVIRVLSVIGVRPSSASDLRRATASLAETLRNTGIVLILDNAEHAEQVSWIAHGVRGAYVIVAGDISIRELPDDLPSVRVPPLSADAALQLLARQGEGAGFPALHHGRVERMRHRLTRHHAAANSVADRIRADRAAAAELAGRYLGFPRVAIEMGRWLAANPQVSLGAVVQDLRQDQQNSELAFILRRQLDGTSAGARRLLGLLACAPVDELPQAAVAAMADASLDRTGEHLAELASRSLVEWGRPSRCRITPEARRLAEPLPAKAAARARTRLAAYYAGLAAAGAEALEPGQAAGSLEAAASLEKAQEWFRAEDVTLLHLVTAPDPPARAAPHLWQIAAALDAWFAREHRQEDRRSTAQAMADVASCLGDDTAAAVAELRLSALARERGDLTAAGQGLERVHSLLSPGDPWRNQLHTESAVYFMTIGDLDAAREHLLASRQARPRRDAAGRSADLINQAALELRQDEESAAHGTLTQALDVAEDSADLGAQAHAHELLGLVAWRSGHPHRASREWVQARALYEQTADLSGQARCLQHQGTALLAEPDGDRQAAVSMLTASLDLRADQQFGVGVALAHLYLAEQAARSARLSELAEHRAAGLSALRSWTFAASEPAEVTKVRKRLTELGRGVLSR